MKELRNRGDETARLIMSYEQEGLEPPRTLKRHSEHLLTLVSYMYELEVCSYRDAIFPDFSGFPDFHKSKMSIQNL